MRQRFPSVSRIEKLLEVSREKATEVRGIIDGTRDPECYESVQKWMKQCYHRLSEVEIRMEALNEVLDGCGVEPIRVEGAHVDSYHFDIVATYVNNGDTYKPTVMYDTRKERFELTSWGAWVEKKGY